MGAFRDSGALEPLVAGTLGGLLTTWVTFAPCFLWIFLGAPYIERLRENLALSGALAAITAAVVGVVLNLALWFNLHVLFDEVRVFTGLGMHMDVPVLPTPSDRSRRRLRSIMPSVNVLGESPFALGREAAIARRSRVLPAPEALVTAMHAPSGTSMGPMSRPGCASRTILSIPRPPFRRAYCRKGSMTGWRQKDNR